MSEVENKDSFSSKKKRVYRKGNPLSDADKQRMASSRKRATHKEIKVFVEPRFKELLMRMCDQDGLTQAEVLARLIEREAQERNIS